MQQTESGLEMYLRLKRERRLKEELGLIQPLRIDWSKAVEDARASVERIKQERLAREAEAKAAEDKLWSDRYKIKLRASEKIQSICKERVAPRYGCGSGGTFYIRKAQPGDVKDALLRFKCGRSDCPYCWRRRVVKTIRSATDCLIRNNKESCSAALYFRLIDWQEWTVINRHIRRRHGVDCGRLHLRTSDNRCLVICEKPFDDATALTLGQAVDAILDNAEELHTERCSFMLLGKWKNKKPSEWKALGHFEGIDFDQVKEELRKIKVSSHRWRKTPEIEAGLAWRAATEEDADAIFEKLSAACNFCANKEEPPTCPKSDSGSSGPWVADGLSPEEVQTPWDTEQESEAFRWN